MKTMLSIISLNHFEKERHQTQGVALYCYDDRVCAVSNAGSGAASVRVE